MYRSYFTSEGMFGLTANISSTFVFMFIIFGAFLLKSGAGDFIVRLANCLTRRLVGGAGLVSVCGFRADGFRDRLCGCQYRLDRCDHHSDDEKIGIHSAVRRWSRSRGVHRRRAHAARNGRRCLRTRQLYANLLPHGNCRLSAASPALLSDRVYFVRIEAKRLGLTAAGKGEGESVRTVLKEGWHFVIPLGVLIGFLIAGRTPTSSAAFAILSVIAASWLSSNPMRLPDIFDAVVDGVRNMVTTALLLVAVGIVINVVTTTGVGNAFSLMIVEWAQGSLLITLVLVALASLVLGMGCLSPHHTSC